jgi:hypothetical protein
VVLTSNLGLNNGAFSKQMGEEGEDISWNSLTERFRTGSGRSSRSPVAVHGEERGEVGKKERRKRKGACAKTGIRGRTPASLTPYPVPGSSEGGSL